MATPKIPTPKTPSSRSKEVKKSTKPITKKTITNTRPATTKTITRRVSLPTPPSRATLLQKNKKTRPAQGM